MLYLGLGWLHEASVVGEHGMEVEDADAWVRSGLDSVHDVLMIHNQAFKVVLVQRKVGNQASQSEHTQQQRILLLCFLYLFVELMITMNE